MGGRRILCVLVAARVQGACGHLAARSWHGASRSWRAASTTARSANPWDPPAPEAYFEVRFTAPSRFTYEGLESAAVAEAGVTTTTRCSSLFEANALARRVRARMPSLPIATFKVSADSVRLLDAAARAGPPPVSDAADDWIGDFSDVVANAAATKTGGAAAPVGGDDDRQAVWDRMLQDFAEREAAAARTDVDVAWSRYLASLRLGAELDVTVIGGESGLRPCDLCNGKGFRRLFGEETTCEWCSGEGVQS